MRLPVERADMMPALVLEPDRVVRATLRDVLNLEGWQVLAAGSGAAGLALASKHKPGLALVDVAPSIEAESFCVGIRIRYGPAVPILALSRQWLAPLFRAQVAARLGAYDVLRVPFDVDRLLHLLERAQALHVRNEDLRQRSHEAVVRLRSLYRVM